MRYRLTPARQSVLVICLLATALAGWTLLRSQASVSIQERVVGSTPVTVYRSAETGPIIVVAHGFAGSRALMEPFALSLARNGFIAVTFDYLGHGDNPRALTGDVTKVQGATTALVQETRAVAEAAMDLPGAGGLALLGHSMASDIIVRTAREMAEVEAVVAVSMFSNEVTAEAPRNLLMISGGWEAFLLGESLRMLRMADPNADLGETVGSFEDGTARRAVASPQVEHVGVLYSRTSQDEAVAWLDAVFDKSPAGGRLEERGGWIALLLAGLVGLVWPLAAFVPRLSDIDPPGARAFWTVALAPPLLTPLILWPIETDVLPVLVADHLALHFALYGALTLFGLWAFGQRPTLRPLIANLVLAAVVAAWGIVVIGWALDSFVASFRPHAGRIWLIIALLPGIALYQVADAALSAGVPFRGAVSRSAFLGSLALAIALNPEDLFFIAIIFPVVTLFFLIFGLMQGWVTRAVGHSLPAALGNALVLAWALGVTFPLLG